MKINMSMSLFVAALFTGVLCGAWAGLAPLANLSVWAGFAGCTAYFASGKHQIEGIVLTITTNLLGVLFGMGMIWMGDTIFGFLPAALGGAIAVGILVTCIVLCGAVNWLAFVPGIFVGCYSLFAINADWKLLAASLVAGVLLGAACDIGGGMMAKLIVKKH